MKRHLRDLLGASFQLVLVIAFSLVAATTIAVGVWVILRTIRDYLAEAMTERVNRDMRLAQELYLVKLREVAGITDRLALDPQVRAGLQQAGAGDRAARAALDQRIAAELATPLSGGNHFVAILDAEGLARAARLLPTAGGSSQQTEGGDWSALPIVADALRAGRASAATEVIPADILAATGLAAQACIEILDTPKASSTLCDPREGSAGLALVGVTPVKGDDGRVIGAAVAFHLFNNDFTLVDLVKNAAGIDTATIFHGDLRVSTNVLTPEGRRAIGTRISQEVSQIVLGQGREYTGPAFVVNENYITRYAPLRNLMSNGVEAMPGGGRLIIRTRRGPAGTITIGIGIPAEYLGKLFTPFFTAKPVGKGTGLGLAITYGIVKMHRGQINVRSQVGQGTTFTIQLPVTLSLAGGTATLSANGGAERLIGGLG